MQGPHRVRNSAECQRPVARGAGGHTVGDSLADAVRCPGDISTGLNAGTEAVRAGSAKGTVDRRASPLPNGEGDKLWLTRSAVFTNGV